MSDEKWPKSWHNSSSGEKVESGLFSAIAGAATGSVVAGPVGAIVGAFIGSLSGSVAFTIFEHHKKEEDRPKDGGQNG